MFFPNREIYWSEQRFNSSEQRPMKTPRSAQQNVKALLNLEGPLRPYADDLRRTIDKVIPRLVMPALVAGIHA
jgi:hypothetical protein